MKGIAIAICSLFLTIPSSAEIVVITPPASQNIEVTIMCKGKPAAGILTTFNLNGQREPYWSGSSDSNGKLFPPKLTPGSYRIVAKSGAREGELDLEVVKDDDQQRPAERPSAKFEMDLILPRVGEAENAPVTAWVRDFQGVVVDPTGALIPNAEVEIYLQKDLDVGPVMKVKTNEKGEFSAHLDKGTYVAIFWSQGFASYRLVFEVTEKGAPALHIPLAIGRML